MTEKLLLDGRFFQLIEEENIIHGRSCRVRSKRDGEWIPLEQIPTNDAYGDLVLGYWEPADLEDVKRLASITNGDLRSRAEQQQEKLVEALVQVQRDVSKHNTIIWVAALCMIPFSWGISLLLLFLLKSTKPAQSLANRSSEHMDKSAEFFERQRDAAREYLTMMERCTAFTKEFS